MAFISAHLDKLSVCTRAIHSAASDVAGPSTSQSFTAAVLRTHLGDLIRDIDSSELSLFTLNDPHPGQDRESSGTTAPELTRAEFHGATPLRRPPARRDDGRISEIEPEVYLQAALKYIHRYQSVRPMQSVFTRATELLEQIEQTRQSIQEINQTMQESQVTQGPSLKVDIEREEQEVRELERKVQEMEKRRDILRTRNLEKPTKPKPKSVPPKRPITPVAATDPAEESFWSTPSAPTAGGLRLTDSLLSEDVDFGNTSASFSSPLHAIHPNLPSPPSPQTPVKSRIVHPIQVGEVSEDVSIIPPPTPVIEDVKAPQILSSVDMADQILPPETPGTKARLRINAEVERIASKIWTTMGDTIMPGHPFQTSGEGEGPKPPRAKETIAHLKSVAALTPSPSSPAASDLSSGSAYAEQPTMQQVLTAHLLVSLLSSPPNFSLPLNKAKDILTAKAMSQGSSALAVGQGATRIVYNCVAKRLIKIERGRGEQTVKFNM